MLYAGNTTVSLVLKHKMFVHLREHAHIHTEWHLQMFRFPYTIAYNNDIKEIRNELAAERSTNSRDQLACIRMLKMQFRSSFEIWVM